MIYHYIPMSALIGDGILLVFILEDGQINFHVASRLLAASAMVLKLEAPDLSDLVDTEEEVDTELPSLLHPQSSEGEGVGVGAAQGSCCHWPQSWQHCDVWPHSWCNTQ